MFLGATFLLNPPPPEAVKWSLPTGAMHLLHNSSFLHLLEKAFHCAYFGLLFVDSVMGTKTYYLTALPLLVLLLLTFKHFGEGD